MFMFARVKKYFNHVSSARTSYCVMRCNQLSLGQSKPNKSDFFKQAHLEYDNMVKIRRIEK